MPAFSTHPRGRGRGDPADPGRRRRAGAPRRADARAAPAPRRPARPAGRQPGRRAAPGRARRAPRRRARCAPGWRRSSPTPSAAPGPPSPRSPTAPTRAEDVLEDDRDGDAARRRACGSRRRSPATACGSTSAGTDPQVEGNLNCPLSVTKSAAFFAVRVLTDPDAPPSAGAYRPIEVIAPAGLPAQRPLPGRRRRRQRRDLEPRRRPRHRRPRRRPPGPRPGPGDDEQPDPRQRGLHLLRDARRRPGRLPRRRRPERDPRGDVEHAQHPGRGAGDRVPAARARALGPPRQRRRGRRTAAATGSCARSKRWRRCASP